jgi:hypothetical protein
VAAGARVVAIERDPGRVATLRKRFATQLSAGQLTLLTGDALRMAPAMGQTWRVCIQNIGLMAMPVFVAALVALRTMAPTRPAWAGAAAGALAGSAGAAVYALHCPELTAPFLAVWYVGGIALPTAVGALIGPRVLRW